MIQVYFKKSPTGSPFFLAYNKGEHGFVTRQKAEALAKAGVIDPIDFSKEDVIPSGDFVMTAELETVSKEPNLSTESGVKELFGNDVVALREYCKKNKIKVSKAVKRPETFWSKIAKHNAK